MSAPENSAVKIDNYPIKSYKLGSGIVHEVQLYDIPGLFAPNAITARFARYVDGLADKVVFDIGTGTGILAIWAALKGARKVYAVDPFYRHIEAARLNAALNGVDSVVEFFMGKNFVCTEESHIRADVILGDVSGIAEKVARALGWYPEGVPAGGYDGATNIVDLIKGAPNCLNENGKLYFPVSMGLSDDTKIKRTSQEYFENVEPVRPMPANFPLTEEEAEKIREAYGGKMPYFIKLIERKGKLWWQGQIFKATRPKAATIHAE